MGNPQTPGPTFNPRKGSGSCDLNLTRLQKGNKNKQRRQIPHCRLFLVRYQFKILSSEERYQSHYFTLLMYLSIKNLNLKSHFTISIHDFSSCFPNHLIRQNSWVDKVGQTCLHISCILKHVIAVMIMIYIDIVVDSGCLIGIFMWVLVIHIHLWGHIIIIITAWELSQASSASLSALYDNFMTIVWQWGRKRRAEKCLVCSCHAPSPAISPKLFLPTYNFTHNKFHYCHCQFRFHCHCCWPCYA